MKKMLLLLFISLISYSSFAQSPAKYWIQFQDKAGTPYQLDRPEEFLSPKAIANRKQFNIAITEEDFPVNKRYIETVLALDSGMQLFTQSKWFNAITVYSETDSIEEMIKRLPFVKSCEKTISMKEPEDRPISHFRYYNSEEPKAAMPSLYDELEYGMGEEQIRTNNIHWLHRLGFKGENIPIMIMDGGFFNVDTLRYFSVLREENRLRGVKNFVEPSKSPFRKDSHGTMVLSCITAEIPGELIGSAPRAMVYLAKTEDGRSETKIEEDNWVAGIEWADSLGCLILNSSLGYTRFDDTVAQPRHYEDLNGTTSRASVAATIATRKGMIVCNSAGNEGSKSWKHIGCPADAKDILTVGAVDVNKEKANFSSFGPTADHRIKPDACAVGKETYVGNQRSITLKSNGTSFSSPLLAGMTACLRQAFPIKSNYEIMNAIRESGHLADNPTPALGYGITDFFKAYNILLQPHSVTLAGKELLSLYFNRYDSEEEPIILTSNAKEDIPVVITATIRSSGKSISKKITFIKGEQNHTLSLPKLGKKQTYDFIDLTIKGEQFEHHYVLGIEHRKKK